MKRARPRPGCWGRGQEGVLAPREFFNLALVQDAGRIPQPAVPGQPSIAARLALALGHGATRLSDPTTGRDCSCVAIPVGTCGAAPERVRHVLVDPGRG